MGLWNIKFLVRSMDNFAFEKTNRPTSDLCLFADIYHRTNLYFFLLFTFFCIEKKISSKVASTKYPDFSHRNENFFVADNKIQMVQMITSDHK